MKFPFSRQIFHNIWSYRINFLYNERIRKFPLDTDWNGMLMAYYQPVIVQKVTCYYIPIWTITTL